MIQNPETNSILNKLMEFTENLKVLDLSFTGFSFNSLFVDSLNFLKDLEELYLSKINQMEII